MPRPRKNIAHPGVHFKWIVSLRDGVWWADGRSNPIKVGRHTLESKDYHEAIKNIAQLDLTMAVRHGLAGPEALQPARGAELSLEDGRKLYEDHAARSRISGGPRKSSQKRYRVVLDKLMKFLNKKNVPCWNRVTTNTLQEYLNYLEAENYSYRTQYLEGTTVKQIINLLIAKNRLPAEAKITLQLRKPKGTNTYCWKTDEVKAMFEYTRDREELRWLHALLVLLSYTGMRIGEAIALRWSDIDFVTGMISLVDESMATCHGKSREMRTLKGGQGRTFPINDELKPILETIPKSTDGYVFHGPGGGRLKADVGRVILVRDVITPLAERFPQQEGEIGFSNGRLHSFRHFFCSLCATKGIPQQVVMRWMGHQDSKLVAHYYHLHDDEARRQMRRISLNDDAAGDNGQGEKLESEPV